KEWADQFKGQFDQGWDAMREDVFARQKELGIVPQDAVLTERPDVFPAWDSLDDESKRPYTRQMGGYAGCQANAAWNCGRPRDREGEVGWLVEGMEGVGGLDDTVIFYVWGDNGASMEGTTTGSFNEMTFLNGVVLDPAHQLELIERYGGIDALGGPDTAPHVA